MLTQLFKEIHLEGAAGCDFRASKQKQNRTFIAEEIKERQTSDKLATNVFSHSGHWRESPTVLSPAFHGLAETRLTSVSNQATRVFNMAACQFLYRIETFSLVFLYLHLFSSHLASASSIRGVALTSKYSFTSLRS